MDQTHPLGEPMTQQNFDHLVTTLWKLRPFRIFTVELITGQRFEVDHAEAMIYRKGSVVFIGPGGVPYWFDHNSVSQIIGTSANDATR